MFRSSLQQFRSVKVKPWSHLVGIPAPQEKTSAVLCSYVLGELFAALSVASEEEIKILAKTLGT